MESGLRGVVAPPRDAAAAIFNTRAQAGHKLNQNKTALVIMKANPVIGRSSELRIFDIRLRLSEIVYLARPISKMNAPTASAIQTTANIHRIKIMRDIRIPHAELFYHLISPRPEHASLPYPHR